MIRQWSYIIKQDINKRNRLSKPIYNRYVFKVFRTTTNFRKYKLITTYFLRKKYVHRKHKTSWISITLLPILWSFKYIKFKQFLRFFQNLGIFNNWIYFIGINFLNRYCSFLSWNYITLTKTAQSYIHNLHLITKNKSSFILTKYIFSPNLITNFIPQSIDHKETIEDYIHDQLIISSNTLLPLKKTDSSTSFFKKLNIKIYLWLQTFFLSYYKIFIFLVLKYIKY